MTDRRNAGSVTTALPYVETSLDLKDDAPDTVRQSNTELTQALAALSSAYGDGMTCQNGGQHNSTEEKDIGANHLYVFPATGFAKYE